MRTELEAPPCVRPAVADGAEGPDENACAHARERQGSSSLPGGGHEFPRLSLLRETGQFTKMLRVVSWNINGIRSPLQGLTCQGPSNCPTALRRILDKLDADIVCLQETKVTSKHSRIQDFYLFFLLLTFASCSTSFHFSVYRYLESCPYTHLKVLIPFPFKPPPQLEPFPLLFCFPS